MTKLNYTQKHIINLIVKSRQPDGWSKVSSVLYKALSDVLPVELAIFEPMEIGGRAKLTEEGQNVADAMNWL